MKRPHSEAAGLGRVFNFAAGPGMLPLEVLESVQRELVNCEGAGMSVMEMSHRSKEFGAIARSAEADLRDIFSIPCDSRVLFLQGGATLQFSAVPLNLLGQATKADYLVTGLWSEGALQEGSKYCSAKAACDARPAGFSCIPDKATWDLDGEAAYVHYCTNETANGVEFTSAPDVGEVPLVADMSSNFGTRQIDFRRHAYIFAGIQKNLGPAGVCVGIVRGDLADGARVHQLCPTYCNWKTQADHGSMYNTPPCFSLYVMGENLKYTKRLGGVAHWDEMSERKSRLLYDVIDSSDGFYRCPVAASVRSRVNVLFHVGPVGGGAADLEKKFLEEAEASQLCMLKGHRSVGGCRASLYNGMPLEGVEKLGDFMRAFQAENPE